MDDVTDRYPTADADDLGSTEPTLSSAEGAPPATRDPRTMPAVVFHRGLLSREERTALARRPRFYTMPWLRLVTNDEYFRDDRADDDLLF